MVAIGRGGYVAHGFAYRGQPLIERTYSVPGRRPFVTVYRPYSFRGRTVAVYQPTRYCAPSYYAFVRRPWSRPIIFGAWGYASQPWYSAYSGAFVPYSSYPGPTFWLTDYVVAEGFRSAYAADLQAQGADAVQNTNRFSETVSDDLKNQIAQEVSFQLRREQADAQAAAGGQLPAAASLPVLESRVHTLQVDSAVTALMQTGGECALTTNDVIQFDGSLPADGDSRAVWVEYSRSQDCPAPSWVTLPVDQLQEMSNHMTEVIDQGLLRLHDTEGKEGVPASGVAANPTPAPFAAELPPPDPGAAAEVQQAANEGDAAFSEAASVAGSLPDQQQDSPPVQPGLPVPMKKSKKAMANVSQSSEAAQPVPTNNIEAGRTTQAQIIEMLGQPIRMANSGSRVIFFYKDMKITFENGIVADIQ